MNTKQLQDRWTKDDLDRVASALRGGGQLVDSHVSFSRHDMRIDLRGFKMPAPVRLINAKLIDVDLSGAQLTPLWLERSCFENVLFDHARIERFSDQGNWFERCSFRGASLAECRLGYQGSQYRHCIFERCSFHKGGAIRAEFYNCRFTDCKLNNVDFEASSFEDCVFEGKLSDVWFRGGYPYPSYERKFGTPKMNRMLNVSFARAELDFCTFSHGCDLSTVILPERGEYRRYDKWAKRLSRLAMDAADWPDPARTEGQLFLKVEAPHAQTQQDWMILNIAQVRAELAPHAVERIIQSLDRSL